MAESWFVPRAGWATHLLILCHDCEKEQAIPLDEVEPTGERMGPWDMYRCPVCHGERTRLIGSKYDSGATERFMQATA